MKKKIVALIMVVPLILMLTIFAISKTVAISVDVPVESIEITSQTDDGLLLRDMATYNNDYVLQATVYPEQAKNKKYTVEVASLDNNPSPCVTVDENNTILLNRPGLASVTVRSNDKGFTDSIKVSVVSSKAYDFEVKLEEGTLDKSSKEGFDYSYTTTTGGDLKFMSNTLPREIKNQDIT